MLTGAKNVFVHAGWNKTATTYLQEHVLPRLTPNYFGGPGLRLNELQVHDPEVGFPILLSDESLLGTTVLGRQRSRLRQRQSFLKTWSRICPQTHFIVGIRSHASFVESLYRQYLQVGGTVRPSRFFSREPGHSPYVASDFLYAPTLELLLDQFPGPHFIYSYNGYGGCSPSLIEDLHGFVLGNCGREMSDLPVADTSPQRRPSNQSVGYRAGQVLRIVNLLVSSELNPHRLIPAGVARCLLLGSSPRRIAQKYFGPGENDRRLIEIDRETQEYFNSDWERAVGLCSHPGR